MIPYSYLLSCISNEYLCLLPDSPSVLDAPLDGARPACRLPADAHDPLASSSSDGVEWLTPMRVNLNGSPVVWNERRIAIRSPNHARISEEALRARLTRAQAALLALGERKRGKRRPRTIEALREAAYAILDSYQVHGASSRDIFGCSKNRQNRIVENSTYPLDDFGFR